MFIITEEHEYLKITISYIRDFILENNVTEDDSIEVDQMMFDALALDFWETYREHIALPFIFLGVWIKVSDYNRVRMRAPLIVKNDPGPKAEQRRPFSSKEIVSWGEVERCRLCGKLLDSSGNELQGYAHELAIRRWKTYDNSIFIPKIGKCCQALKSS